MSGQTGMVVSRPMTKDEKALRLPATSAIMTYLNRLNASPFFVFGTLFIGLTCLAGRFSWAGGNFPFAVRGFFASAYLFLVSTWTVHRLLTTLGVARNKATTLTAFFSIPWILPYRWWGYSPLARFSNSALLQSWKDHPLPIIDWIPDAAQAMPHEMVFFVALFVFGALILRTLLKSSLITRTQMIFYLGLWGLLLTQTYFHLSLRSPYTYVPHFEQPKENNYWYHYYLFENRQGAVNMDYHDFRHTEELFLDSPRSLSPMMTRAYPTYIASAFLTFFHPLRVYLTLNLFAWVLGAVSFVYVGNRLVKDQGAVKLGLTFFCSAQGLIFYVAQPMMYVFAISGIIIVFAIYLLAFSKKDSSQWKLFGAALGLFSLCYESQPFFFAFLLFAYFRKDSLVDIGKSLLLALFVRQVYLISCSQLPFLVIRETLAVAGGGHPVSAIRDLLKHGEWIVLAERFFKSITGYSDCMSHAFQLSLLFAFFGIFFATSSLRRLLLPFFVPGFLTYALFELSQSFYTRFPRLVYSGYPAIYLLAGVGMSQLGSRLSKPFKWIPWALVFIHITWVNLDSFGYPWIYYEWFYRNAGFTR